MESLNSEQENRDSLVEACSSCCDFDGIADKLLEFSVLSADDNVKIKTVTEKYETLVNILMEKGSHLNYLVQKITELKVKWNSVQDKTIVSFGGVVGENRVLTSAEVSEDWPLKIFLLNLADSITPDEFEKMKDILGGELGFKANALDKIDKPMKLFKHMLTTRKINRFNIIHLQCLLWHLKRKDLMQEFIVFSNESKKRPVYFYSPRDTPENGYRYLNFHVKGDITDMTVQQLDQLRMQVASTLCVPPQFVFLDGIQPSNSILLTFMVPDNSIETFISCVGDHDDFDAGFGLRVEFTHNVVTFREICSEAPKQTTEQKSMEKHLKDLLLKEEKLKADLDDQAERLLELQLVESSRDATKLDHQSVLQETDMYRRIFQKALEAIEHINISGDLVKNGQSKNTIPSLQIISCLSLQTTLLSKANAMKLDKDLLRDILQVNSTLTAMQERQKFVNTLKDYRYIVQTLESRADSLQQENYSLKANTEIPMMSSNLKDMLTKQELARVQMVQTVQLSFSVQHVIPVPTLQLDPQLYLMLKTMTEELSGREYNQLRQNLILTDREKLILETDRFRLLEIALQREVIAGKGNEPPAILLKPYLRRIQRTDLIRSYLPVSNTEDSTKKVNKRRRPIRQWKRKY